MTTELMTKLIGVEYELCSLQSDLGRLAQEIRAAGVDGAFIASRRLMLARRLVRRALGRLDKPLTEAATAAEALAPPPF